MPEPAIDLSLSTFEESLLPAWKLRLLKDRSFAAFAVALGIIGAALLMRVSLNRLVPGVGPYITLFPAVALAGMFCGPAAALVASLLALVVIGQYWIAPQFLLAPSAELNGLSAAAGINFVAFTIATLLVIGVTAWMRRALRQAERARSMLDTALGEGDVGAWEIDLASGRISNSGSMRTLHRLAPGKLLHGIEEWLHAVVAEDVPKLRRALREASRVGSAFSAEYRLVREDGLLRHVVARGRTVRTGTGPCLVGASVDITARVRVEEAMREQDARLVQSEASLRVAVDAGGLGLWETELATGRSVWDKRLMAMLRLGPEMSPQSDKWLESYIHPEDRAEAAAAFAHAVQSGERYIGEFRVVVADGETRWFAISCRVPETGDAPTRVIGVVRDVTDRRLRIDALQEAVDARELLVREADHRIKNSLQLVISLLRLQWSRLGKSDTDVADALVSAIARVEAVAQSHQALQQSKDLTSIDLGATLHDLCDRLGQLNPSVRIDSMIQPHLLLDTERAIPMALIVSELVTNALQHAYPAGEGVVTVTATSDGSAVTLRVADDGVGTDGEVRGTGLGSSVTRSLSRQVGAELDVRTAPGRGTSISISIPRTVTPIR